LIKKVEFISMDKGTKEDYDLIAIHQLENERGLLKKLFSGFK